ncbi:MAG: hypothetical protein K0R61_141 [Microvirga sp.]|jgi:hypothetical protein|nr:hypothetical protein [Microvirga sp.]
MLAGTSPIDGEIPHPRGVLDAFIAALDGCCAALIASVALVLASGIFGLVYRIHRAWQARRRRERLDHERRALSHLIADLEGSVAEQLDRLERLLRERSDDG